MGANNVITNLMKQRVFKGKIHQTLLKTNNRSDPKVLAIRQDIDALDFAINELSKGMRKNGY